MVRIPIGIGTLHVVQQRVLTYTVDDLDVLEIAYEFRSKKDLVKTAATTWVKKECTMKVFVKNASTNQSEAPATRKTAEIIRIFPSPSTKPSARPRLARLQVHHKFPAV